MSHLLHVFSTFQAGGPQVRTTRLVGELEGDWRHTFVALDGHEEARELLPEHVTARLLPGPAKGTLSVLRWTRGLLARERPDLLLTYNWGAIEVVLGALTVGARVLHHEDGFLPEETRRLLLRRTWARRLLLRGTRGVVVPSHRLQEIARASWWLPEARVHLIPNGVRLDRFHDAPTEEERASLRRELGIPRQAPVLGTVGHLRPEKNPLRLVEAFALLADGPLAHESQAHLILVGDGPERARIEGFLRERGLVERVHLAGHRPDPRPAYAAMDVFCLSSDTEQMPVALLEAMASGLAAVSTDVGDVRHVLPEEQGDWITSLEGDATSALAAALRKALAQPDLRRRLGAANRARVAERYSFRRMREAYEALYQEAAGRAVAPRPRRD